MKRIAIAGIIILIAGLPALTNSTCNNATKTVAFLIPWGKMTAELNKEIIKIKRYDMEMVKMNVSYEPYFIQFFPVFTEIHLTDAPAWLSVIISTPEFYLQPEETKTINIYFKVNEEVENGTQGIVKFEIDGKNILLPSLLEIDSYYASVVVIKTR